LKNTKCLSNEKPLPLAVFTVHCNSVRGFKCNVDKLQQWNGLGQVSRRNMGWGRGGVLSTEIYLQVLVYATQELPQLIEREET